MAKTCILNQTLPIISEPGEDLDGKRYAVAAVNFYDINELVIMCVCHSFDYQI